MKKFALISLILLLGTMTASAQCGWQLTSAYKNGVEPAPSKCNLKKAWKAINEALEKDGCEKEKDAWFYRATILSRIAGTKNEKYQKLTDEPLRKAFESYQKVIELDEENDILLKVLGSFAEFSNAFVVQADLLKDTAEAFRNQDPEKTAMYYEKAFVYTETATAAFLLSTMPLAVQSSDTITKDDARALYADLFNDDLTVNSEVIYHETAEFLDDLNNFHGKTALEDIQALGLQIGPMTATLYPRLVQYANSAGLYDKAALYCKLIVQSKYLVNPTYYSIWLFSLAQLERSEDALAAYDSAITYLESLPAEEQGNNKQKYQEMVAYSFLKAKDYDGAIAYYTNLLEAEPGNTKLMEYRAIAYEQMGEYEKAAADYKAILEKDTSSVEVWTGISRTYVERLRNLNAAKDELPLDDQEGYDAIKAEIDETMKEAIPYLEGACKKDPTNQQLRQNLKNFYIYQGQMDKANALGE